MIEKMPVGVRGITREFMQTREFPGEKTLVGKEASDKVLAIYEVNLVNFQRLDNTAADQDPDKDEVETHDARVEFGLNEAGDRIFLSRTKGDSPVHGITYGSQGAAGMDLVTVLTDASGENVLARGAIHLNRRHGEQSFRAGDLKSLPGENG